MAAVAPKVPAGHSVHVPAPARENRPAAQVAAMFGGRVVEGDDVPF
jgi:hypothetical protein